MSLTAESPIHAATYIYNGDFSLQIKTHSFESHDRQLCGVLGRGAWHRPGVHVFELGHPVQHSLEPRENLGALGESGYDHSTKLLIGNHTYKNETGLVVKGNMGLSTHMWVSIFKSHAIFNELISKVLVLATMIHFFVTNCWLQHKA